MNIYVIRHGQTDWNRAGKVQGKIDRPLTELGIEQAYLSAKHLENLKIDKLVSSPLIRAYKTAEIIDESNKWNLPIIKDENFMERSFGVLEGTNVEEFIAIEDYNQYEGYESDEKLLNRVTKGIEDLLNGEEENVVVVCHSHILKALLIKYALDLKFTEFFLPNCAIMKLEFKEKEFADFSLLNCEIGYHKDGKM